MAAHLAGGMELNGFRIFRSGVVGAGMLCAERTFGRWSKKLLCAWAVGMGFLMGQADWPEAWGGLPRIDPSGERIFLPPAERTDTDGSILHSENVALYLNPQEVVAPIGSEVILVATVVGPDRYTSTNERVEWSIAAGSVGEFVQIGKGSWLNWLVLDFTRPRKLCNSFAVTSTLRRPVRLSRGTPDLGDDLVVHPGQAWVSVSSPTEGTSYVSAYAPSVAVWGQRRQTARIHWVDAQWTFPSPANIPAGTRHTLTTTLLGRSDGRPRRGWLVRYEIVDGPAAGFAPEGAKRVEVATNEAGQASVELFQPQPAPGTNRIQIQVLRPFAGAGPEGGGLVLASGMTTCTWSAPQLAVRIIGPSLVGLSSSARYTIEVSNPGDLLVEGVRLAVRIPEGAAFLGSTPPGQLTGLTLQWDLGTLGPGQIQRLEMNLRADRAGVWNICAEALSIRGLRSQQCTSTTVTPDALSTTAASARIPTGPSNPSASGTGCPEVELRVFGPSQATVGQQVRYDIILSNRTSKTISGLVIRNRFGPGLRHEQAPGGLLERALRDLPPGAEQHFYLVFQVVQPGQVCYTVEIYSNGQMIHSRQLYLTAEANATTHVGPLTGTPLPSGSMGGSPPGGSQPPGSGSTAVETNPGGTLPKTTPALKLQSRLEPAKASVGQQLLLTSTIQNTTLVPLSQLLVQIRHDAQLIPKQATQGARWTGQEVEWLVSTIPPGEYVTLQVQYLCKEPGTKVCTYTYVTAGHEKASAEACLSIEPAPASAVLHPPELVVTVTDLKDSASQGDTVTYVVSLHNQGQRPDLQVVVTAKVSNHLLVNHLGTSGPAPYEIQGQQIRFRPVGQIRPGEKLTYRIVTLAHRPGEAELTVNIQSQSLPTPKVATEKTHIKPKGR
ncbi:MAG: hypothetical protein RMI90_11160 [Thermoguttaceae bacterium]|nr:hypothetical protein [Thermoguttaceae bacterium]